MRGPALRDRPPVAANLTPMIDVTFLLIVFFVVVSQIVEVENVEMELPRPWAGTSPPRLTSRIPCAGPWSTLRDTWTPQGGPCLSPLVP